MKKRLDILMVEKGLAASRSRAQAEIMAGRVFVNGRRIDKAGASVDSGVQIAISSPNPYVSRGGLKLAKALEMFNIDPAGLVVLDLGASTGGFTDCALQRGALKVYAVDVGYGQLAWSLRNDARVVSMERKNLRLLRRADFDEPVDLAVVDVSFISLRLVFPVLRQLEVPAVIALIKPQFEAGKGKVGKKGVVRDSAVHLDVLESVIAAAAGEGYRLQGLTFSPLQGPQGNIEYLAHFDRRRVPIAAQATLAPAVIDEAQKYFCGEESNLSPAKR